MSEPTSRLPGFFKLSLEARHARLAELAALSPDEADALIDHDAAILDLANRMVENAVGAYALPIGLATNFRVDGVDRLVPLVIEEPSVVAACSHAAKLLRSDVGIVTSATEPLMIAQVQLCDVPDLDAGARAIRAASERILRAANEAYPRIVARGGGAREVEVRQLPDTAAGPMLVVHLVVDVRDAMGANLVNGMAEAVAPICQEVTGGRPLLRILSNYADRRLCSAVGRVPLDRLAMPQLGLTGLDVARGIEAASAFAEADPYRAATHNKGIMNGVDAFMLATGQDWRAIEAGAHAHAARGGRYTAMATWRVEDDALVGRITLPMQVGTVGGITRVHPVVKTLLKVVAAQGASDVGRVAAAVGLAQNLAAVKALATEGIQRGHMSLHARNIAASLGARGKDIDRVVAEMIRRKAFSHAAAEAILAEGEPAEDPAPSSVQAELVAMQERTWPQVVAHIEAVLPRDDRHLSRMAWYQIDSGGKRLRVALPLAVAAALGTSPAAVVPFAAAMELLHNGTLVHADLQARKPRRRGRQSVWVRFGEAQAVNCGSGMMFAAMRCLDALQCPSRTQVRVMGRALDAAQRIIAAQAADRTETASPVAIARERVGGMFGLALAGAGEIAGLSAEGVRALDGIGRHLGLVFQLQDELKELHGADGVPPDCTHVGILLGDALSAEGAAGDRIRDLVRDARAGRPPASGTAVLQLLADAGSLDHASRLLAACTEAVHAACEPLPADLARVLRAAPGIFVGPLLDLLEKG